MSKKDWLKSVLVYLCITFFIITTVFVYMSLRGKPQAGLIEVSCSAALFVIFLYVIKKVLPQSVSIIATILSILIAVIFIFANYYLQLKENKNYTFKQILIGDLLAKKFIKEEYKESYKLAERSLTDKISKNEFSRRTTEKYTIESPYERPEKLDISENPMSLTLDVPYKPNMKSLKSYAVDIPDDKIMYNLKLIMSEAPIKDNALAIIERAEGLIYEKHIPRHLHESVDVPLEINFKNIPYAFSNKDEPYIQRPKMELHTVLDQEHNYPPAGNQTKYSLQKP